MDGWASLLMDDAGNSIYAPVNMLCLWRRSGQGVPQGTGTTHGIVVHNELPRYGNVGRYQIRVLDESGFGMEWAGESAYTEFAEWDGNPHKYSFGTYAKFNSRYAYNRLESITPSDDISSGKTVPNAELFCENHVETTAAEAWPIAGTGNYNNPEVGSLGTSLTCKAYFVKAGVKGWYRWEGNEVVGYNGLRMEFSTASLNGSHMLLGFSFAAGTISATTSKTYPAHWCVEYSVDGGQSYTLCPSAATGADYVHLRSLPWWDASLAGNRYNTCSSAGIGLTDHLFRLPAEGFGRERVTLAVQRVAEDFFLPSPTGSGVPLSRRELEEKLEQLHPSVFFSHELCARYFTYMSRESGAHFVLFDDRDTLRKKLEVAQELGITSAVAALPEVLDAAGELGIRN